MPETSNNQLTSSFSIRKFWRYQKERFPLGAYVLLIGFQFPVTGLDLLHHFEPLVFSSAFVLVLLFYFRLRLFDEIKDYETDRQYRPERIVARGEVTLTDIRVWMGVTVTLELLLLAILPESVTFWYLIAAAWSVLMYFEFFVPKMLHRQFFLYGLTHMFVVLPLALAMRSTFSGGKDLQTSLAIALSIMGVSYLFEVGRKLWRPTEEKKGVESYSGHYGTKGALVIFMILMILTHAAFWWAYSDLWLWNLSIGGLFAIIFLVYILGTTKPLKGKFDKLNALYILLLFGGLIVGGVLRYGFL